MPQPTIIDNVALTRTGYKVPPLDNDVFSQWAPPPTNALDTESIDDDLKDITDIIGADMGGTEMKEMSDFDRELISYVLTGFDPPIDKLTMGPSASITEIDSSSSIVQDDGSFGGPKLEEISPTDADFEAFGCVTGVGKREASSGGYTFTTENSKLRGVPTPCMYSTANPNQVPRVAFPTSVAAAVCSQQQGGNPFGMPVVSGNPAAPRRLITTLQKEDSFTDDIVEILDEMMEDATSKNLIAPEMPVPAQLRQQHSTVNRTASLPAQLPCHTAQQIQQFPMEIKQEVVTPTSPQLNQSFFGCSGAPVVQQRPRMPTFNPTAEQSRAPSFQYTYNTGAVPQPSERPRHNGLSLGTSQEDANMNFLNASNGQRSNSNFPLGGATWYMKQGGLQSLLQDCNPTSQPNFSLPSQQTACGVALGFNMASSQQNTKLPSQANFNVAPHQNGSFRSIPGGLDSFEQLRMTPQAPGNLPMNQTMQDSRYSHSRMR